jgi:hypothetical protein
MTIAIAALGLVCVALLFLISMILGEHSRERTERAAAYERTLQSMADRIQRPDVLPFRDTKDFQVPEQEPDEWATVGQIDIDPKYGLEDEDG